MSEPNGVIVMTTCKCRENTKNLVMTRTWFEEQLQNKVALGAKGEQDRIIAILQKLQSAPACFQLDVDALINQVQDKGEIK
jgi:hypothetical protein